MSVTSGVPRMNRTCSFVMPGFNCATISWEMKLPCWITIRYGVTPGTFGTSIDLQAGRSAAASSARTPVDTPWKVIFMGL